MSLKIVGLMELLILITGIVVGTLAGLELIRIELWSILILASAFGVYALASLAFFSASLTAGLSLAMNRSMEFGVKTFIISVGYGLGWWLLILYSLFEDRQRRLK